MNMRNTGLLFLLLAAAVPACSDDNKTVTPDAAGSTDAGAGGTAAATLSTSTTLGAHLVDKDGKTLYFYINDVPGGASACTGACLTSWPPVDLGTTTTVGDGLTAADFASITTSGAAQTTWKGRPLYHFAMDAAVGDTKGEGAASGHWFVARAYNLFFGFNTAIANAPAGGADKTAPFLTDGKGHTLYVLQTETPASGATPPVQKCGVTTAAACAAKWPLWEKPATLTTPVVPSTVTATALGSFTAEGGKTQFTYKGWATYFFAPDSVTQEAPGAVAGAAVANWHAINKDWDGTF
jgi:predicted lipoprotein with Yx(FWY)xxD motif